MKLGLQSNDEFLESLKQLFKEYRTKGPVVLTMKRYNGKCKHESKKKEMPPPTEYMCLLRAYAQKKKISTVVHQKEVGKFQTAYCTLLRASIDGLKKSKKNKKTKAFCQKPIPPLQKAWVLKSGNVVVDIFILSFFPFFSKTMACT